jgi:hypothetical protein
VLRATYETEKRWVEDVESQIAEADLPSACVSWFLARRRKEPAGVLPVHYAPPIEQYRAYDVRMLRSGVDVDAFLRVHRLAEIGRFAITPAHRRNLLIAVADDRACAQRMAPRAKRCPVGATPLFRAPGEGARAGVKGLFGEPCRPFRSCELRAL